MNKLSGFYLTNFTASSRMKVFSSKFSYLPKASGFVRHLSPQAPLALVAVSDSQITTQDGGNVTQAPPAPSMPATPDPQTGDNASYNLGSTTQAVIDQCMSDADKDMLTHVNDARSQARACGSDNYPATAALSWHCTLEDVAQEHNRDMGDRNFFSHTGSDGLGPADRVGNAGYDWSAVGENIAAGQQTIDAVMQAWLDSPGHCANIMRASYTEFGAASYTVNGSDFPIYWTQLFARPRI
jgi:uncharacterized protein YkwD